MVLRINGVDMTPFISRKGLKWKRNDLDGENAGRTLDGVMHRDRVGSKVRLDITCLPLSSENAAVVLHAIYPEYVTVEYLDPMLGMTEKTMYSNNNPATFIDTVTDMWEGIEFALVEV